MEPDEDHAADWRDAAAYTPLLAADRSLFAWEWLRRDPSYRAAARKARADGEASSGARPQSWGLEAFQDPDRGVPHARPVWSRHVHPAVLPVFAEEATSTADSFELQRLAGSVTLIGSRGGTEHVLLSNGFHAIRLDVVAGSLLAGPVKLRYFLAGIASADRPLLTLERLLALCRTGRFSGSLHAPETRARRWLLALRAWDAVIAGAGQREIARVLLGAAAGERRWRSEAPSLRSQAQRLVRGARCLAGGEYRALLQ